MAGPAERVDALESVSAGFVDLTKFKLGETVTLSITLPEGIRNLDALQSVDVTFDTYGFATRTVTVSQITVVNAPSDTTVTVTTPPPERCDAGRPRRRAGRPERSERGGAGGCVRL